jgi:hypothetical protein
MTTKLFTIAFFSLCLSVGVPTFCQAQEPTATESYWVIETNLLQRNYSIVRFYNTAHQLIYEEQLNGIYLDVRKRRTKKLLNETLRRVTDKALVAGQIRKTKPLVAQATVANK